MVSLRRRYVRAVVTVKATSRLAAMFITAGHDHDGAKSIHASVNTHPYILTCAGSAQRRETDQYRVPELISVHEARTERSRPMFSRCSGLHLSRLRRRGERLPQHLVAQELCRLALDHLQLHPHRPDHGAPHI